MRCERCSKKFREELGLVKKNRNYTERFKNKIIQEVIASDIKNVAQRKRSIVGMKYSRILRTRILRSPQNRASVRATCRMSVSFCRMAQS